MKKFKPIPLPVGHILEPGEKFGDAWWEGIEAAIKKGVEAEGLNYDTWKKESLAKIEAELAAQSAKIPKKTNTTK